MMKAKRPMTKSHATHIQNKTPGISLVWRFVWEKAHKAAKSGNVAVGWKGNAVDPESEAVKSENVTACHVHANMWYNMWRGDGIDGYT